MEWPEWTLFNLIAQCSLSCDQAARNVETGTLTTSGYSHSQFWTFEL